MGDEDHRIIPAIQGKVQCLEEKKEPLEHCRLCIHCREFRVKGTFVKSPSLAYCIKFRVTDNVDLAQADAVKCADRQREGFHSITSIIG